MAQNLIGPANFTKGGSRFWLGLKFNGQATSRNVLGSGGFECALHTVQVLCDSQFLLKERDFSEFKIGTLSSLFWSDQFSDDTKCYFLFAMNTKFVSFLYLILGTKQVSFGQDTPLLEGGQRGQRGADLGWSALDDWVSKYVGFDRSFEDLWGVMPIYEWSRFLARIGGRAGLG